MKILILQPFGLGDVIFCMTIARRWIKEGHSVTWPVFPQFVEGLQRAYPDVTFVDWREIGVNYERKDEHDWLDYRVIPLRWNVEIMNVPYRECMASKYSLFGWDWQDWKEGAMWERDKEREAELDEIYKPASWIYNNEPYELIFDTFGSDFRYQVNIPRDENLKHVVVAPDLDINRHSIFDLAGLMLGASCIKAVSSSCIYLFEMLNIACPIHIYKREPIEKNHDNYKYILQSHNYILH